MKSLKIPKFDVPPKKTAYNLFNKDMQETKRQLQGVTVSKASAIISKDCKKVKVSDKKIKKYRDLYEAEKQQYEEAQQRYQQDHLDKVEIISLHKRCNKTATKAATKAATKTSTTTGAKAGPKTCLKVPRSREHLFLREKVGKMTGEARKNYHRIVSRKWKRIKKDPARLIPYNNRAKQMSDETNKPTKSGDDFLVGSMVQHEEMVTERPVVKRIQTQLKKALKSQHLSKRNQMTQTMMMRNKKLW